MDTQTQHESPVLLTLCILVLLSGIGSCTSTASHIRDATETSEDIHTESDRAADLVERLQHIEGREQDLERREQELENRQAELLDEISRLSEDNLRLTNSISRTLAEGGLITTISCTPVVDSYPTMYNCRFTIDFETYHLLLQE